MLGSNVNTETLTLLLTVSLCPVTLGKGSSTLHDCIYCFVSHFGHSSFGGQINLNVRNIFFLFFLLFRAVPMACGGSQARGLIGAVAIGLHHSHSNAGFEPHLQPTPELRATSDP